MQTEIFWPRLASAFGNQKVFWTFDEKKEKPGVTDRLLHYLISYWETPAVARKAVRVFNGIESQGYSAYSGWDEVRVATIREVDDALHFAGATGESWELALTIKDFLQNTWLTLDTVILDDISKLKPGVVTRYIKQLRAVKNSWEITNDKGKKEPLEYSLRFSETNFYKQFKKYRQMHEPVLPSSAIDYLEYLLKRTGLAPFEIHANRILQRLGLFKSSDEISVKLNIFGQFLTEEKPVAKHKHLVQLGKVVCFIKDPRCNICPVSDQCPKKIS